MWLGLPHKPSYGHRQTRKAWNATGERGITDVPSRARVCAARTRVVYHSDDVRASVTIWYTIPAIRAVHVPTRIAPRRGLTMHHAASRAWHAAPVVRQHKRSVTRSDHEAEDVVVVEFLIHRVV